ncbi:MAG: molybdopterin-dependent oxidoreductase [Actinomycetota bacterium]|nr:molybdopterin-dependent oxidoreductase [Actinomycetota bacterium]
MSDLLTRAGAGAGASAQVESMQVGGIYSKSILEHGPARDGETLLALEVNGEPLHPDHGKPLRLIGPNRPGVQQTKWVHRVTVS